MLENIPLCIGLQLPLRGDGRAGSERGSSSRVSIQSVRIKQINTFDWISLLIKHKNCLNNLKMFHCVLDCNYRFAVTGGRGVRGAVVAESQYLSCPLLHYNRQMALLSVTN